MWRCAINSALSFGLSVLIVAAMAMMGTQLNGTSPFGEDAYASAQSGTIASDVGNNLLGDLPPPMAMAGGNGCCACASGQVCSADMPDTGFVRLAHATDHDNLTSVDMLLPDAPPRT